jgi:hypothetical protein
VIHDVTSVNEGENRNKAHKKSASKSETIKITPKRVPDKIEERTMIGKVIEIMVIVGMENHVYKFGNVIRKQKSDWVSPDRGYSILLFDRMGS